LQKEYKFNTEFDSSDDVNKVLVDIIKSAEHNYSKSAAKYEQMYSCNKTAKTE